MLDALLAAALLLPAAIGFNVETVSYKNIKFQVWDLGGQTSIRPYWRCYYPNTQAIIYVVDSSDVERIGISKEEFHAIVEEEELKDALILVYANKQVCFGARGGGRGDCLLRQAGPTGLTRAYLNKVFYIKPLPLLTSGQPCHWQCWADERHQGCVMRHVLQGMAGSNTPLRHWAVTEAGAGTGLKVEVQCDGVLLGTVWS